MLYPAIRAGGSRGHGEDQLGGQGRHAGLHRAGANSGSRGVISRAAGDVPYINRVENITIANALRRRRCACIADWSSCSSGSRPPTGCTTPYPDWSPG